MIKSKKDLKYYIQQDTKAFSYKHHRLLGLYAFLVKDFNYYRIRFLVNLRKHEYILNVHPKWIVHRFIYKKRKNRIGRYFNWEIPANVFGPGLQIWHPNIVVNDDAKIGANCLLRGSNCIGRKGNGYPTIGDNFTLGFGSVVVGEIKIGDNVTVGANSFVNKDFVEDHPIVLVGSPAKILKK